MIYPSDFEEKIGFTPLRELLIGMCDSAIGKKYAVDMHFYSDPRDVVSRLHQTAEMVSALSGGVSAPSPSFPDIFKFLKEAKSEGSFISAADFLDLKKYLVSISEIATFFNRSSEEGKSQFPYLNKYFNDLTEFPAIVSEIDRIINRFGEVKDTASPELHEITRKISSLSASMSTAIRRIMASAVSQGIIDKDATPAMRDGRLVIPVASVHKRSISGIVHDVSATGKTSYIEPAELVEGGNRLRELENQKQREIAVILTRLTDVIRPDIDDIIYSARRAGYYDFVKAKARLAEKVDARMPVIEKKMEIDWYHAVHPVLDLTLREHGKKVVPLNIRLEGDKRVMIISGPNAGGKSVCLKTVGIVQYMMQCGLLPTVYENSHMGILSNIFIDIGDQQSIEDDLSTYSSHLRNMKYFLSKADSKTLVLIDEIGSGTEPQIGGALAQAILGQLAKSGCFCIATTHYQNLKTFAEEQPAFVNASMLYDRQKLQPLFQLSIGHPGSSFALEIAKGIGLPQAVIEDAKQIVGSDYVDMDKYLLDIARDRKYWANKRLSIKEKEHKISKLLDQYEQKADELNSNARQIIRQAKDEARDILASANSQIERTIHEIKLAQAEKERTKSVRAELEDYKKKLSTQEADERVPSTLAKNKKKRKKNNAIKPASQSLDDKPFLVGENVQMKEGSTAIGQILSIDGKQAEVAFGALRTFVRLDRLKHASAPNSVISNQQQTVGKSTYEASRERQLNFNRDLDVRGMRADEALQAVTYFLDDATQFEADRVRILHGTGTGALRLAIRQYLKTYPQVVSFADEDVRLGGAGITVVNLS